MKTFASLLLLTFTFSFGNLHAASVHPPNWEMLGSRQVKYGVDHDVIMVTAQEGRFTAVKLMVKRGGINMHKMVIHFGDGSRQDVELRNNIPAGGESRVINLEGERRVINRVEFWYDTKNLAPGKAVVQLWGRH